MNYVVYIIKHDPSGKFYIGQTEDIDKRLKEHNEGKSGFTGKLGGSWTIVYKEYLPNRSDAIKRELFLKKQRNRSFYLHLIQGFNIRSGSSVG